MTQPGFTGYQADAPSACILAPFVYIVGHLYEYRQVPAILALHELPVL